MPIFDQKLDLLNQISALRSLVSGFPQLNVSNSFPSLNNKFNQIDFLLDLIKTLVGYQEIKEEVTKFLTINTEKIQDKIKELLLFILKSKFSCGIDAIIPQDLIQNYGGGFNIAVSQVDFFEILKIDPNSRFGKLIYEDDASDLNRFLYSVLQGNSSVWKNLIVVEFLQYGLVDGNMKSNVFNVKISQNWYNKTVNDFMNAFLREIVLFTNPVLLTNIFDIIFGSISFNIGKGKGQIESEVELDILVDKIIDLPDTIIDNSYFDFDKQDIDYFNQRVDERSNGRLLLRDCNCVYSAASIYDIENTINLIKNSSTLVEIKTVLDNQLNILANSAGQDLSPTDQQQFNLNFFASLFRAILKALVNIVLSPKVLFVLITYFKIVNLSVGFKNFKDFLNDFKQFIIDLVRKTLMPLLIDFLLKLVIKYVTKLVAEDQANRALEFIRNQQSQILSLVGIPQQIRDVLNKLSL